jgi:hypothetical protein
MGQITNIAEAGNIGSLAAISAVDSSQNGGTEAIVYDVHELFGNYYIAAVGSNLQVVSQTFTMTVEVIEPLEVFPIITDPVPVTYTTPVTDTAVETLILFNETRFNQLYTGTDTITTSALLTGLNDLAAHPSVNGLVVNLDNYAAINQAYSLWDNNPGNPQQANFLARNIKGLLYSLYPAYPNLKYVVIVGGDQIVPFRRIQDKTLIANERTYGSIAEEPTIVAAFDERYVLTDDYYVAPLPMKLGEFNRFPSNLSAMTVVVPLYS